MKIQKLSPGERFRLRAIKLKAKEKMLSKDPVHIEIDGFRNYYYPDAKDEADFWPHIRVQYSLHFEQY